MNSGPKEEWRPAVGWEGVYEVSDYGRFRRVLRAMGARVGRIMKPSVNPGGYLSTVFHHGGKRETVRVHTCVALAFLGPRPEGLEIDHKDGCKTNNLLSNLQYVTHLENMRHARAMGLFQTPMQGERHTSAKLTERSVRKIRLLHADGRSARSLGFEFGVSKQAAQAVVDRRSWKHVI